MRLKKNVKITGIAILVAAGLFAGFHFLDSKEERLTIINWIEFASLTMMQQMMNLQK